MNDTNSFSNFFKNKTALAVSIVIAALVFAGGYMMGQNSETEEAKAVSLVNKTAIPGVDFGAFWQVWNIINEKYVATNSTTTDKVSDQTRVYGAISGMVASLGDPYTTFFPPVENKSFTEQISGNFQGVGMEVGVQDNILTVIAPLKGTPAYKAGIKTGDKILQINDITTDGLSTDAAVAMIRGKAGTTVTFRIARAGVKDLLTISIVRDVIDIPTIDTETKGDVFVIHMYNFSAISADLFRGALRSFVESGKVKLLLDLRGNPGGYLDAAIDMASWFLPAGKTVVKEDFRDAQDAQVYASKGYDIFDHNKLKMVVLMDGGSASASEILAGALHDNGVAELVGQKSFGKGSVQELVPITPDTSLKVTIARWLTPNGISISHQGLLPDEGYEVALDKDKFLKGEDTQMTAALQILDGTYVATSTLPK